MRPCASQFVARSASARPKITYIPEPPQILHPGDEFESHANIPPPRSTKRPHSSQRQEASSSKPPTTGPSALGFFDRRKRGTTPPADTHSSPSTSSTSSHSAVPLIATPSPKSRMPKFGKSIPRRPHTSSGVPTRPFGSTESPTLPEVLAVPADEDHPSTRRRLSSNSDEHPALMTSAATSYSGKLGFEPEQVRAWEEELDRIASFSKRRSLAPSRVGVGLAEYAVGTA